MRDAQTIRESVAETYGRAVAAPARESESSSCCTSSCCTIDDSKGVAVKTAGYTAEEVSRLPSDVVQNAFGCGNPLAFAGVQEGDTVLDLGSGAGIDLLLASTMVGPTGHVIGVDMTDAMIERARANISGAGATNVEVRKGLIEDLPVEADSVDWVISNCVVNLSPEKDRVFGEMVRVLRPGGRISISDIVVADLPEEIRRNEATYNSCVGGAISEAEYVAGLEGTGLVDVEVTQRQMYDESHLRGMIENEFEYANGNGGTAAPVEHARDLASAVVGSVWSARFSARKPG